MRHEEARLYVRGLRSLRSGARLQLRQPVVFHLLAGPHLRDAFDRTRWVADFPSSRIRLNRCPAAIGMIAIPCQRKLDLSTTTMVAATKDRLGRMCEFRGRR